MNELLIRTRFGILAHGVAGRQDMQLTKNERVIRTAEAVDFGGSTAANGQSMAASKSSHLRVGPPRTTTPGINYGKNLV